MKEDDRIVITWDVIEVTHYKAVVTIDKLSELTGVPVAEVLTFDTPGEAHNVANLDLADELANIEDDHDTKIVGGAFNREDITLRFWRE